MVEDNEGVDSFTRVACFFGGEPNNFLTFCSADAICLKNLLFAKLAAFVAVVGFECAAFIGLDCLV